MKRRDVLQAGTAAAAWSCLTQTSPEAGAAELPASQAVPVRYCLNMGTIQGERIPISEQVEIASRAGYSGVELWLRDIATFTQAGGTLADLRNRIADAGLTVESAIAFGAWLADDEATRKKGLDDCRRDMDIVRELGGRRIAAPPAGATNLPSIDLDLAAERYRTLLEIGRQRECIPQIEVWGFSKNCYALKQTLYICAATGHADACILPDVFHLYKGGSDFVDVAMLAGPKVHCFHINDYPAAPPRAEIKDEHRVYPGDGVAPLRSILQTLFRNGFTGALSLELFNRTYWAQDPNDVATTGLAKMKAAVADAARRDA